MQLALGYREGSGPVIPAIRSVGELERAEALEEILEFDD
jgi:hypothetical protein